MFQCKTISQLVQSFSATAKAARTRLDEFSPSWATTTDFHMGFRTDNVERNRSCLVVEVSTRTNRSFEIWIPVVYLTVIFAAVLIACT